MPNLSDFRKKLCAYSSYDNCCKDVEQVDNDCCDNKREPDLLYAELSVLAELVVKRSCNVLEENDLLLGKSSDSYLNDGDTAVAEEGKSYNEVEERDPAIDQEERYKESE